jgi:flagellar M-ring protein FliF
MPAGIVRKMSLAVLVDQDLKWEKDKSGFQRVLIPPPPEKLKIIHDLVAGVTGFTAERGDLLVIETLPFETTLLLEPPQAPVALPPATRQPQQFGLPFVLDRKMLMIGGGALAAVLVLLVTAVVLGRRRKKSKAGSVSGPAALPAPGHSSALAVQGANLDSQIESQLQERDALQKRMDAEALASLKLAPVITKKAEVFAKHLREKIASEPEAAARVLRSWIREEEN